MLQVQRGEFLYREELEPLVDDYRALRPEQLQGAIRSIAGISDAHFIVSGSHRLATGARNQLRAAGVAHSRIRTEDFGAMGQRHPRGRA